MLDAVHEESSFLVVNKPAGLVCHPTKDGEMSSLIGRVRLHLGHGEGRLINRLDRETSGLVVIAKDAETARALGTLFAGSAVVKQYWAIVHGHVTADALAIDAPLGKDEHSAVAIKDCVRPDGAPSRTLATVRSRFLHAGARMTWLEVTPETGRKHQIRIHLAHSGHPIVGDKIYGDDERRYLRFVSGALTEHDRNVLVLDHHALHAHTLQFVWRGREWAFTAPPGAAFGAMLTSCRS
ncbi:MAG TPA: RluA family pseudouridine synthase [Vicinamibacterales bacterium]|nr:RluA family pseudouridine synthase [Vicinamibacterales bacterium]